MSSQPEFGVGEIPVAEAVAGRYILVAIYYLYWKDAGRSDSPRRGNYSANQPLALTVTLIFPPLGVTGMPVMDVS